MERRSKFIEGYHNMALSDLWNTTPEQLEDKHIRQIIAFAGTGKLRDDGDASKEFRDFLSIAPSFILNRYANECLSDSFNESGQVLQDIINQVGKRLGFTIIYGRYRGSKSHVGNDGLWRIPDGGSIVIEVKTTDAYRIDLDTIAGYRSSLLKSGEIEGDTSSILIVVGRDDTGGLEAQIRGSKHAWDIRLISVDALLRLMSLKEEVEDPQIMQKIRGLLIPQEYTKVDGIIDIVFSTTDDVRQEDDLDDTEITEEIDKKPKFTPVKFHDTCIEKIRNSLACTMIKRSRVTYSSPDDKIALVCLVSREHQKSGLFYWFAFQQHQKEFLANSSKGYVSFGCGSDQSILLVSFDDFNTWVDGLNVTDRDGRFYWHVHIFCEKNKFILRRKKGHASVDLTKYLLPK